jgi:hypothetical protein
MESNDQDQMNSGIDNGDQPVSLSPEYFALLSRRGPLANTTTSEKIANLLLASDIPELLSTSATSSQAYQYILSIPDDMNMKPFCFQDVLPNIIFNIRCACENLATKSRAKITQSGILLKLAKLSSGGDTQLQMMSSLTVSCPSSDAKEDATMSSTYARKANDNSLSGDVHVEFLHICIMASQYHFARLYFRPFLSLNPDGPLYSNQEEEPLISSDASTANASQPKLSTTDTLPLIQNVETYLRYRYLRGIIHYALDEIHAAVQEWNLCISTPGRGTSHIVVEAYKKLILAKALLFIQYTDDDVTFKSDDKEKERIVHKGDGVVTLTEVDPNSQMNTSSILRLPNGVSIGVSRKLKSMIVGALKIYSKIANAIEEGDTSRLEKLIDSVSSNDVDDDDDANLESLNQEYNAQYILEDNRGMAKRLIGMMKLKKLRKIARVYDKIPLSRLATKMGMSSVEECMGFLIQVGMKQCGIESAQTSSDYRVQTYIPVKFSIDEEHQVIYFDDDNEVHEELEEGISDFIELARRVKHLDMITTASTKYQVKKKSLEKKPPTTGKTPVRSVADLS